MGLAVELIPVTNNRYKLDVRAGKGKDEESFEVKASVLLDIMEMDDGNIAVYLKRSSDKEVRFMENKDTRAHEMFNLWQLERAVGAAISVFKGKK